MAKPLKQLYRLYSAAAMPAGLQQYYGLVPRAKYGGRHTVAMLPGDGVGPELMQHVRDVFRAGGVPVNFEEVAFHRDTSDSEHERVLLAVKRNGVAIKGNIRSDHQQVGFKSKNIELRNELKLFANIVKVKSFPNINNRHHNVDIVIIRENREGEYKNLEHENVPGVVESLKIITRNNSERIAKYAFDFALAHNRRKVTCVHKANIMKMADGMFLESCRKISELYPDIEFNDMIVDNCCMQLVSRPQQFDVMLLPNLYGNIVSNIAAGLVGGAGVVCGENIGEQYAIFEQGTRNTGSNIAGKNIANPSGMLLAGADMLEFIGQQSNAMLIRDSVHHVLSEKKIHTPDLGGTATSQEVVQAIIQHLTEKTQGRNATDLH